MRVEPTSHGTVVRVRNDEGGWVRLVSDRDPIRDARSWVDAALGGTELPRHCIVIGPALGHVLDVLCEMRSDLSVVAIEPYAELATPLRAHVAKWAGSHRVVLLAGPEFDGTSEAWRALEGADTALTLVNPVLRRQCPSQLQQAITVAERVKYDANANAGARAQFAAPYLLHTLENLNVLARARNVARLFGRFRGVPIVVVAAGPSLDRSIQELRSVRDRVLLVAVDTALRPLLYHDLEPDLVVGVDPGAENARHLRNLPPFERAWFVAEPSLHPDCFAPFGDRVFAFRVADHAPWPWLRSAGVDGAVLRAWGSVLTCAFDLALRLGGEPIAFVGADLAYTNRQPYCRGTAFERDWADAVAGADGLGDLWQRLLASRELIDTHAIDGAPTQTTRAMLAFRDWLVEAASATGCEIVNATGGGILAGGRIRQDSLTRILDGRRSVSPDIVTIAGAPESCRRQGLIHAADRARAMLAGRAQSEAIADWLAICREPARLEAALVSGTQDAEPRVPPRRDPDGWRRSPVLLAPERAWVFAALSSGEPLPPEFAIPQNEDEIALWCQRVQQSLADADDASDDYRLAIVELARRLTAVPLETPPAGPAAIDLASRTVAPLSPPVNSRSTRDALRLWPWALARCEPVSTNPVLARACDAIARAAANRRPDASRMADATSCQLFVGSETSTTSSSWTLPFVDLSGALTGLAVDERSLQSPSAGILAVRAGSAAHASRVRLELGPASAGLVPFDSRWPLQSNAFQLPFTLLRRPAGAACYYVTQARSGRARLVCSDRGVAMDVAPDGTMRDVHTWPAQVGGEVEWRQGVVAWTCGEHPRIFFRGPGGAVAEFELPARAFVALATEEEVLFPSIDRGVWGWRPDAPCRQLIDTPPINSIRFGEEGFELDPILVTVGPSFPRVRLDYTWLWNPAAGTLSRRASDAGGQVAPVATHGDWTARVYPYADMVRIDGPAGVSVRVHVAHALMAAFAGTSLVVTTGSGRVLFFEALCEQLADRQRSRDAEIRDE